VVAGLGSGFRCVALSTLLQAVMVTRLKGMDGRMVFSRRMAIKGFFLPRNTGPDVQMAVFGLGVDYIGVRIGLECASSRHSR